MYNFSCDYLEGCHPAVLKALEETNLEQHPGYGLDPHCDRAAELIRATFKCPEADVHFLVGGTQVNTTIIASALRPFEGVLCADTGHINVHETGAIEATGHKVLPIRGKEGRVTGTQVSVAVALQGDFEHTVKPGMVYISQSTELGTVYDRAALVDLYHTCQDLGLYLYIDGARLGVGLQAETCDLLPADLPKLCDAFTVGGTKNGALFGEALVIVNPALKKDFRYMMKRQGGLLAKGRLLGVQFEALMEKGLYFTIAKKTVDQAMRVREALLQKGLPLLIDSPTNQLFPILTDEQMEALDERFIYETWERVDEKSSAIRLCTSWATTDEAVEELVKAIAEL